MSVVLLPSSVGLACRDTGDPLANGFVPDLSILGQNSLKRCRGALRLSRPLRPFGKQPVQVATAVAAVDCLADLRTHLLSYLCAR